MKRILKAIYNALLYPILKALYKPILDEIRKNAIDKSSIFGLEMFLRKEFMPSYNILNPKDSVKLLVESKKPFIRIGDGDLPLLGGKSGGMHSFNVALRDKLFYALKKAKELNVPIGINPILTQKYELKNELFYACEYLSAYDCIKYLPSDITYFDALVLRYSPIELYAKWGGAEARF